ncbi:MAG TPA: LacI family DNA-binding transcriptional regulator [Spirochaetales bacterium]|nr:LacI family DNA-binding transcriptional regulator [Spirochaetales bacterium]HRY53778.1 LacI family DNA-binding transcriptional regulator [Spirochaetia bacterium]HRZ64966.1 LacI family DNA-binding transcriptional regulator [Spirochaetia bacterium]
MDIRGIAKEAGVSISTVSRVLNGTKRVSPEVAERVRAVVERYEYSPDPSARAMVLGTTEAVGLVVPAVSFSFFNSLFSALAGELATAGYQVLTCTIRQSEEEELRYLELLRRKRVDGIILMHETSDEAVLERLRHSEVPLVLATVDTPELEVPSIGVDDYAAGREATEYLIGFGHRRIAFIDGNGGGYSERQRLAGYLDAISAAALAPRLERGDYSPGQGQAAAARLLAGGEAPTAIFAANDEMAIGAIKAAEELGVEVPAGLSVLGFDDIGLCRYTRPSLSTVRQDIDGIAKTAVSVLLAAIEGSRPAGRERIVVPHRIMPRASCAPAR